MKKSRKTLYEVFNKQEKAAEGAAPPKEGGGRRSEAARPAKAVTPRTQEAPKRRQAAPPLRPPKAKAPPREAAPPRGLAGRPAPAPTPVDGDVVTVPRSVLYGAGLVVVALLVGSYYLGSRTGGEGGSRIRLARETEDGTPRAEDEVVGTFWAVRVITLPWDAPTPAKQQANKQRVASLIRELKARDYPEVHARKVGDNAVVYLGRGVKKDDVVELKDRIWRERYEGQLAFRTAFCVQLSEK